MVDMVLFDALRSRAPAPRCGSSQFNDVQNRHGEDDGISMGEDRPPNSLQLVKVGLTWRELCEAVLARAHPLLQCVVERLVV